MEILEDNRKEIERNYINIFMSIEALNKLRRKNLITDEIYKKSIVQIKQLVH